MTHAGPPLPPPPPATYYAPPDVEMGRRGMAALMWVGLVVLVMFVFGRTYGNGFILLDDQTVQKNNMVWNWGGLRFIWGSPKQGPEYAPVAYTALLLEYKLWSSTNVGAYHLMSMVLHLANAALLWTLLRRLELPGAWIAAVLFAVHPVQVDAVAWISQQKYLLSTVFYLLSLLVYLRAVGLNPMPEDAHYLIRLPENRHMLYALATLLFLLALLSAPMAGTFALVVLLLIWWERGTVTRREALMLLPHLLIGISYIGVVAWCEASHATAGGMPGAPGRFFIGARGVWFQLFTLAAPLKLMFAYPKWSASAANPVNMIALLAVFGLIGALWAVAGKIGRGPLATFLLFLLLLIPTYAVKSTWQQWGPVADHMLYLPCAAIFIGLVTLAWDALAHRPAIWRNGGIALASVLVAALSVASFVRTYVYKSQSDVWANDLKHSRTVLVLNSVGNIKFEAADVNGADDLYREALSIDRNDAQTNLNLAKIYESRKDWDKAIACYYFVQTLKPEDADPHFLLAGAYSAVARTGDALVEYHKALELRPDHAMTYNNLGLLHAQRGEYEDALKSYKKAVEIDKRFTPAYINLANLDFQLGRLKEASDTLETVLKIDSRSFEAWMNAGAMVASLPQPRYREASRFFRQAVFLKPTSAEAFNNLGQALVLSLSQPMQETAKLPSDEEKVKTLGEAIFAFNKAIDLNPDSKLTDTARRNVNAAKRLKDQLSKS